MLITQDVNEVFVMYLLKGYHDSHVVCTLCLHNNLPEVTPLRLDAVCRCPDAVVEKILAAGKEIVEVQTYDAQQLKYEKQLAELKAELAKCVENKQQQAGGQHRMSHILEHI